MNKKKHLKNEKKGTWLWQASEGKKLVPTEAEQRFIDFLKKYSIDYEFQKPVRCSNGKGYIIDFVILFSYKTRKHHHYLQQPIEIDGGYHNENTQRLKDVTRDLDLLERSHFKKVIHMPNEVTESDGDIIKLLTQEIPQNKAGQELIRYLKEKEKTNAGITCLPNRSEKKECEPPIIPIDHLKQIEALTKRVAELEKELAKKDEESKHWEYKFHGMMVEYINLKTYYSRLASADNQ